MTTLPTAITPPSALAACGQLDGVRIWARLITGVLTLVVMASFVTPWTQNVSGEGRIIAYSPSDRETPIRAPIDGRVVRWYVVEGQQVEPGDPIVELRDNDPQLLNRLGRTRDAARAQETAMEVAIRMARQQVQALDEARDAALASARLEVRIARDQLDGKRQDLLATKSQRTTADINLKRQKSLNSDDLSSDRDLELAQLSADTASAKLERTHASVRAAERKVQAAETKFAEIGQKKRASIDKARGELAKLEAEREKIGATIAKAETDLARQDQMLITAPRAGRILAVSAREGSEFVKSGQSLAMLVPDTEDRAVELWVDGNDAPLITPGRHVRLQFEGWPAVQFVGWPSVAVGTFGGQVAFVDAAVRNDGRVRVVVVPAADEAPWPGARYLRQGVRARGWVLLNRVTVAFELWRQLNGFPPATQASAPVGEPTISKVDAGAAKGGK